MVYNDEPLNLTTEEAKQLLLDAGIDPDVDKWTPDQLRYAGNILDKGQADKIDRLIRQGNINPPLIRH